MRKLVWGLCLLPLLAAPGAAQVVLPPDGRPVGLACSFIGTPPTLTAGQVAWVRCAADSTIRVNDGSDTLAVAQTAVATTATPVCPARPGRRAATITNVTGTAAVYIGPAGVTTASGAPIAGAQGSAVTVNTSAQVYAVAAAAGSTVSCTETY